MSKNENSIQDTILSAISEVTGRPFPEKVINGDSSIYQLGIDSMGLIELIFALEAMLEIDIPLAELNESIFESLDSLGAYLQARKQLVAEQRAEAQQAVARSVGAS